MAMASNFPLAQTALSVGTVSLVPFQAESVARTAAEATAVVVVTVDMGTRMANMGIMETAITLFLVRRLEDTLPNITFPMARSSSAATEALAPNRSKPKPFMAAPTQATLEASLAWLLFKPT